jgi:hypothetical protein
VFNDVLADPAFGVISPVFLDQLTPSGRVLGTVRVPSAGGLVTSFSSKSELALNVSASGREVPVPGADFRVVAQLDGLGRFRFTTTNAYSRDNGRAAILKDSGSNGVNTVYFVDTTGKACPDGVGVPQPGAQLPTSPIAFDLAQLQDKGVVPDNMCVLPGFPTALKSATSFPAGGWFANASTLYVTDEGNGTATFAGGGYTAAAAQATAGLQKWVRQGGTWKLAYTLTAGLHLGVPYAVRGYPAGDNPATGLPWSPATDGLRNIAGRVNANGTVTIWAITSTVSGSGDPGADPDKLVAITDRLAAATAPAESFTTVRTARFGEVLRGVSFTPGSVTRP